jgi:phosphoribosylanthranilate isomerase
MQRVKVKICGVRTQEEARTAIDLGADALGFNFWSNSPRYLAPERAREMIRDLAPFLTCVGVFVNEDPRRIRRIVEETGIHAVQLHGDEDTTFVRQLGNLKIIKAFRIDQGFDLAELKSHPASAFLLDSKVKGEYGGTGQRFDWRLAVEAKKMVQVILAGGLNPENVGEAITSVRPYAVDVCSGVESEPGRKDLTKLREFITAVERANRNLLYD